METNNWVEKIAKPAYEDIESLVRALDFDTFVEDYTESLNKTQALAKLIKIRYLDDCDEYDREEIDKLSELPVDELRSILFDELTAADLDWDEEEVRALITDAALEVSVRSGWYSPGSESPAPEEFMILLSTGGPAVRIRGELDRHGTPDRAWLEVQDWGKPWTEYRKADEDVLLRYASVFYFVDGGR